MILPLCLRVSVVNIAFEVLSCNKLIAVFLDVFELRYNQKANNNQ
jgi:hypothetical protein